MKLCSSFNADTTFDSMSKSVYYWISQKSLIINCMKKQFIFVVTHLYWYNCVKSSPSLGGEQRKEIVLLIFNLLELPMCRFWSQSHFASYYDGLNLALHFDFTAIFHCHFSVISLLYIYILTYIMKIHLTYLFNPSVMQKKGNIVREEILSIVLQKGRCMRHKKYKLGLSSDTGSSRSFEQATLSPRACFLFFSEEEPSHIWHLFHFLYAARCLGALILLVSL